MITSIGVARRGRGAGASNGVRLALRAASFSALCFALPLGCSSDSLAPAPVAPSAGAGGSPLAGAGGGVGGSAVSAASGAPSGALGDAGNTGAPPGSAGSISGAAGNADTGAGGGASAPMWTMNAGKYALTLGSTYLEVDPSYGARITALRVGGSAGGNLLADATVTGQTDNWGSTFWPSPQTWPWPPTGTNSIAAINSQPYGAMSDAASLTLTSALNPAAPALTVVKKFSADLARQAVVIDYAMTNGGTMPVAVAPWEITRVAPGGITFYSAASPPVYHATPPLETTDTAGATWYQHDPADTVEHKLFADGKDGWIAHAAGDLLLIKSFADIPASASPTGEAEIEIYAVPKYVEMETQGAMQTLMPGQALHWTVRWYARKLAAPAVVGSAELVAYVQNQIK